MTMDSAKGYRRTLTEMTGQAEGPRDWPGSFLLCIDADLFIWSEIFIRISCDHPCQPCEKDGSDPFYDCAHVVLHNVSVQFSVAVRNHLDFSCGRK